MLPYMSIEIQMHFALWFDKVTFNDPLNSDVWENMKDKWDTTADFKGGEIVECGDSIIDIFEEFESDLE